MEKVYYSPSGFWKGYEAVDKLAKTAGVSKKEAREWLQKQPIWQIYLPRPKYIPQARFDIEIPNEAHQADLLFLPNDGGYRYALTVADVASRFKEAEPLKSKRATEVSEAFQRIYSRTLTYPKTLMIDPGKEFMGEVSKLMKSKGVVIRTGRVDIHKDQAIVERFNKTLAERLFSHQYNEEIKTGKQNTRWVKILPSVVQVINNESTKLIRMKPSKAVTLDRVKSKPSTPYHRPVGEDEKVLPIGTTVRFLYEPGEAEGDKRQRATDPIWSVTVHEIVQAYNKPSQPVLYYITEGKRGYVREELQVI